MDGGGLLAEDEPRPVIHYNAEGRSPFLLIGDHAGNLIPRTLGTLGLEAADRTRHIAWDIGVAGLGETLADMIDAPFLRQTYSRLVIDCNRDPETAEAIPLTSDGTPIPGNAAANRAERIAAIHEPYQQAIARALAARVESGRPAILVALHSFTPVMAGHARPWQIGVLHDGGDPTFALRLLAMLQARADLIVGDNEPYRMDATDHTVPRHAYGLGLPYAEIEIRQDLIEDAAGQEQWARILASALAQAAR